jgi:hypothetical protein
VFAPGLISIAFYKKRPSPVQLVGGVAATVALSALLGYISPAGPLGRVGSVIVAIVGGLVLYFGILAFLLYYYQPKHAAAPTTQSLTPSP